MRELCIRGRGRRGFMCMWRGFVGREGRAFGFGVGGGDIPVCCGLGYGCGCFDNMSARSYDYGKQRLLPHEDYPSLNFFHPSHLSTSPTVLSTPLHPINSSPQNHPTNTPITTAPPTVNPTIPPDPPKTPTASPVKGDGDAVIEVLTFVRFPIPVVSACVHRVSKHHTKPSKLPPKHGQICSQTYRRFRTKRPIEIPRIGLRAQIRDVRDEF